jgi:hypothetical protein
MKIAILSRKFSLYSTRRIKEAGEARGHQVQVIDYVRCYMNITSHRPMVMYQGRALEAFDAVIPRIGASQTFYGTAVVRQFEMMGVYPANESQAITRSRDKLRCLQLLARQGIGLPGERVRPLHERRRGIDQHRGRRAASGEASGRNAGHRRRPCRNAASREFRDRSVSQPRRQHSSCRSSSRKPRERTSARS